MPNQPNHDDDEDAEASSAPPVAPSEEEDGDDEPLPSPMKEVGAATVSAAKLGAVAISAPPAFAEFKSAFSGDCVISGGGSGAGAGTPAVAWRLSTIPMPSKTAKKNPVRVPLSNACLGPYRALSMAPVQKPALMLFHGSSLPLSPNIVQSNDE